MNSYAPSLGRFVHTGRSKVRNIARPLFHRLVGIQPREAGVFTPAQIAEHYNFPPGDGTGQNIALIELGGGVNIASLAPYWKQMGIATPNIVVFEPSGTNSPGSDADGEVCLDICVAACIAPKAQISVIFADNTDQDFDAAVRYAVDVVGATVISISWGGPEDTWPQASLQSFDATIAYANSKGVQVVPAAGDNDSGDGQSGNNADFPGSSPHALCGGGTYISGDSETVWNDGPGEGTGGGFSSVFAPPAWQVPFNATGKRSVPDVAGDADPASGWLVSVNGDMQVIGGTSAVAPMWAALIALLQQATGKPVTQAQLYAASATFTDITQGNNGAYSAGVGFDQCSGLGVPNGVKLLAALQSGTTAPPVAPPVNPPAPIGTPSEAAVQAAVDAIMLKAVNAETSLIGRRYVRPVLTQVGAAIDQAIEDQFSA